MTAIRTNAAAAMLGVSASTLRSWEQRFGYPSPRRTEGGHRQFELTEIESLKRAFEDTHNVSSAISIARERGEGLPSPQRLSGALAELDQERADRLMEESMALRSVERTVGTVLLPAVQALLHDADGDDGVSPEYGFAWRYATGWLAAALRVAPCAVSADGVLIIDAARGPEVETLYVQALELCLRRGGLRVLTLPAELQATRVGHALRALRPRAMVLGGGGGGVSLDTLARLVYAARQSHEGPLEVLDYRGAVPDTGASTIARLAAEPLAAATELRELLSEDSLRRLANGDPPAYPRAAVVQPPLAAAARAS